MNDKTYVLNDTRMSGVISCRCEICGTFWIYLFNQFFPILGKLIGRSYAYSDSSFVDLYVNIY